MSTIAGLSLEEYVERIYVPKQKNVEVTVSVGKGVSSAERLKRTIANLNKAITKCGIELWDEKTNTWENPLTQEQLANIQIPIPSVLTDVEKLKRATAFASKRKEELGGLQTEPIVRGLDYI